MRQFICKTNYILKFKILRSRSIRYINSKIVYIKKNYETLLSLEKRLKLVKFLQFKLHYFNI